MPVIDFKEIPPANSSDGTQDTFELFARDFFEALGMEILDHPNRGPDGGRDILMVELQRGTIGNSPVRWLVSCKHKAHTGQSVTDREEYDPLGHIRRHHADGFIAFYSSIPSSGLAGVLTEIQKEYQYKLFDKEIIENYLLSEQKLQSVFKRYFPESYKNWREKDKTPKQIFSSYEPLPCVICGKDLLLNMDGNVVEVCYDFEKIPRHIDKFYWACKDCDTKIDKGISVPTYWNDLDELSIPLGYIRALMSVLNGIREGETWNEKAFSDYKICMLRIFQLVARQTNDEEFERLKGLATIWSLFS